MADRQDGCGDLRERLQLDAARVFMLCGAVTIVGSLTGSAAQATLGLFLWLLGVCLLAFVPVAGGGRRFPWAALAAGAVVGEAVQKHFFVTP
jgi:hypothetical protein